MTTVDPTLNDRLYEPTLVRRVGAYLARHGVPVHAVDDVLQQARLEVWQRFAAASPLPEDVDRLFFHVARLRAIDLRRSERRHVENRVHPGADEEHDDVHEAFADPTPTHAARATLRDALAAVARDVAGEPELAQALCDLADKELGGHELDDLARRRGVPAARVRKGVFKLRAHAGAHLADYRAFVALAVVALVIALVRRAHTNDPAKDTAPRPLPTVVAPEPSPPTSKERADQLRSDAKAACDARHFGTCSKALVEARALDPQGDTDPAVQSIWKALLDGTQPSRPLDPK